MRRKHGMLVVIVSISVLVILTVCLLDMNRMNKQDRFDSLFQYVCESYTFDWKLIKAMAITESSLNPMAVSPAGALGIMQLMPGTAADMRVIRVFDPEQNIKGGAAYFDWLLMKFYGAVHEDRRKFALASYNGGFGYILEAQHLAFKEGKDSENWEVVLKMLRHKDCVVGGRRPDAGQIVAYVDRVMKKYEELKGR